MKKVFLLAFAILFTSELMYSSDRSRIYDEHDRWLVMMGYGYAYTSDINASGTGGSSSIIYLPHKIWGFGLDMGTNQTEGVSRSWDEPDSYENRYNKYSDWFIGPSVYLFPVNSKYHRVHVGVGGNIFDYHEIYIDKYGSGQNYIENKEISISTGQFTMCNIGFHASVGYSVKFLKHFELGVRTFTSFYQEGFNLNALLNLSVSF